jgi:hypothetical protein
MTIGPPPKFHETRDILIAVDGIELFPISSVPVTRYRWRATTIPSAWPTETIEPAA